MSVSTPLLEDTIEPDEVIEPARTPLSGRNPSTPRTPVVLNPGARSAQGSNLASTPGDAEAGGELSGVPAE